MGVTQDLPAMTTPASRPSATEPIGSRDSTKTKFDRSAQLPMNCRSCGRYRRAPDVSWPRAAASQVANTSTANCARPSHQPGRFTAPGVLLQQQLRDRPRTHFLTNQLVQSRLFSVVERSNSHQTQISATQPLPRLAALRFIKNRVTEVPRQRRGTAMKLFKTTLIAAASVCYRRPHSQAPGGMGMHQPASASSRFSIDANRDR